MTTPQKEFHYSTEQEPHRNRTKEILQHHPEIRALIGKNPKTLVYTATIVAFQITLAYLLREQPWWLIAVIA
jgi:sphingolipid delta-4 desaturase